MFPSRSFLVSVLSLYSLVSTSDVNRTCHEGEAKVEEMKLAFCLYTPPGDKEVNLPPVIMLHGMMDSKLTWRSVAPKIANYTGRKVYTLDARNHGDSGWSEEFNFDILANDLDEFMEQKGLQKAVIVGHSMGGKTAITLALNKPERVEKLVVEDITPRNITTKAASIVLLILRALKEAIRNIPAGADEKTAAKEIADFMEGFVPADKFPNVEDRERSFSTLPIKKLEDGRYGWKANMDVLEELLTSKDKALQQLSGVYLGDSLYIYGTNSFFKIDQEEPLIKKYFPRAQFVGLEASHLVHMERPTEFLQNVVDFINGHPTLLLPTTKSKY